MYPLQRIDDSLDALAGSRYLSTWDLVSGYWQNDVYLADRHKTAFTTTQTLFEFQVMPFGLCNGLATFQRLMESTLAGLHWSVCLIYLDDIVVFSHTFEEHLKQPREVFQWFLEAELKLKLSKYHISQPSVSYLGHVSQDGIGPDPTKVECLKTWPVPVCLEQLRRFMGLATYYRKFIKGFSQLCAPLQRLTEKNVKFLWDKTCDDAFRTLKRKLTLNLTDSLFWIQTPVNPPLAASCRKRARMANTLLRSEVAH